MTYSILHFLKKKDPNITLLTDKEPEEMFINYTPYSVAEATLSYTPKACEKCGVVNDCGQVEKHGFNKASYVKLGKSFEAFVLLKLRKQRFKCKECHRTFIARTPLVDKNCFISNPLKKAIQGELGYTQSMTDISDRYDISVSSVIRTLDRISYSWTVHKHSLPEILSFDECMTTEKELSFVYMDAQKHTLIDILPSRKKEFLRDYFLRFPLEARENVAAVTMDMYAPYETLVPEIFPNAIVITDRFHIVQHLNVALNRMRIETMNSLRYEQPRDYKKLKDLWKLVLKNREELDVDHYKFHPLFTGLMTEKMIVDYLINLSPKLTQTYDIINDLKFSVQTMDSNSFFNDIMATRKVTLRRYVRTTLQTFTKREASIRAAMDYSYSNGALEGMNNKIKNNKRAGYGFSNFRRFKTKVFLTCEFHRIRKERKRRLKEERQKRKQQKNQIRKRAS